MGTITRESKIEEIIRTIPGEALSYLTKKGICGLRCYSQEWGTLGKMAIEKNFTDAEINLIINELNAMLEDRSNISNTFLHPQN